MTERLMRDLKHRSSTWGEQFKKQMKEAGITQVKLAKQVGISARQLSRILNRYVTTEEMQLKLGHAMIGLTQRDSLYCHVDYLRLRFEFVEAEMLIKDLMHLRFDTFHHTNRGLYGYDETYQRGDVRVMTSMPGSKLGTLLEMHGSGCRQLESALERDGRDWVGFFYECSELNAKFKRLDIAINDTLGIIDVPRWIEKAKRGEYVSTFRTFRDFGQMKKEQRGATLQFGSPQSDIQFVIYQKNIEQFQKNGVDIDLAPIKNRFEIRLQNKLADRAVEEFMCDVSPEEIVFGIIEHYLRFVTPMKSKDKSEWPLDPEWETFMGANRNEVKLFMQPEPVTINKELAWLRKQVAPTMKMVQNLDSLLGTDQLQEMINEAELTDHHKALLNDVLEDNQKGDYADQSK